MPHKASVIFQLEYFSFNPLFYQRKGFILLIDYSVSFCSVLCDGVLGPDRFFFLNNENKVKIIWGKGLWNRHGRLHNLFKVLLLIIIWYWCVKVFLYLLNPYQSRTLQDAIFLILTRVLIIIWIYSNNSTTLFW